MKKMLNLVILLLILPFGLKAQLVKWSTDRPLTWSDFKGRPPANDPFMANTNADVSYSYTASINSNVYTLTFKVEHNFTQNISWVKPDKQTPALLQHEQLHFDLSEYFARTLYRELTNKTYTANYQQEVRDIFASIMKRMKAEQIKYDADTQHSINKEKQADWEAVVRQQLLETPPYQ